MKTYDYNPFRKIRDNKANPLGIFSKIVVLLQKWSIFLPFSILKQLMTRSFASRVRTTVQQPRDTKPKKSHQTHAQDPLKNIMAQKAGPLPMECPVPKCGAIVCRVDKHLQSVHGMKPGDTEYRRLNNQVLTARAAARRGETQCKACATREKEQVAQKTMEAELDAMKSYASITNGTDHGNQKKCEQTPSEHMVEDGGSTETKSTQSACQNSDPLSDEISKIMDIVNKLKSQHEEESHNTKKREAEQNEKIQHLIDDRKKMASEIELLLTTVAELTHENSAIKNILDMKQTEWVNATTKVKPSKENQPHSIQVENQFEILKVEDDINESEPTETSVQTTHDQILEYRSKAQSKFNSHKNKQTKASDKQSKTTTGPASKKHEGKPEKQDKRTLVIGDSMVKNIDQQKIQRAAGDRSVVHLYSGAKVDQIMMKIKNGIKKDQFETVILHVGTNDLVVNEDPELVATKMDELITETKSKAGKVAVSRNINLYEGNEICSF